MASLPAPPLPSTADAPPRARTPWTWIPSLYVAEGIPYVMVMTVSVLMYKDFGISNTEIALVTSLLYLPWVIKPLWSPVVDLMATRRRWVWATQLVAGAAFAGVAFVLPGPDVLRWSLACFWLLAFDSATHDIAADGFYLLALPEHQQAYFVGLRSTFYRVAMILGQGPLVILAGLLAERSASKSFGWSAAMAGLAVLFLGFSLWHAFILPRPARDRPGDVRRAPEFVRAFFATFGAFFRKPKIGAILAFLLLYRFGEAQLVKMTQPFLKDPRAAQGLGLTVKEIGFLYGLIGVFALLVGGIVGGWVISRHGLRRWLWPMMFAIHLPDAVFVYLAYAQPASLPLVQLCIAVEQFGYGFGLTAFLMYMIHVSRGEHPTAHYAICTGFMALGMMIPGMWSGWLADHIGYRHFFGWVIVATIPSFLVARAIPLDPEFGRKPAAA
jgi:PAT family beta-lactamase induction signal transducer AmpG